MFHSEIIADSHTVAGNNTEGSSLHFTQFPPQVMSDKTMVQYHNQDIDFDTVQIEFPHHRDLSSCPFRAKPNPPSPCPLTPVALTCSQFCNCVFQKG